MAMKIQEDCIACGACLPECPTNSISEGDIYVIDPKTCVSEVYEPPFNNLRGMCRSLRRPALRGCLPGGLHRQGLVEKSQGAGLARPCDFFELTQPSGRHIITLIE